MALNPDPSDLTTVANLEAWMGLTNVQAPVPDQLQRLITATSGWIQNYISRTIRNLSYNETRDGTGGTRLVLRNVPVTAVASVVINGQTIPPSPGYGQPGYIFSETAIVLRGYTFTMDSGNVQISYTAGYATTPGEMEQACLELCSLRWKERDRIGHASKTINGETVTFIVADMPESVKTMLSQYNNVVPA